MRKKLLDEVFEKELLKLPEASRDAVRIARATPGGKRSDEQRALFKKYPSADVQGALSLYDAEANKKVTAKAADAAAVRAKKPPEPMIMVMAERRGPPPPTYVFHRGDHDAPREAVGPAALSVLGGRSMAAELPGLPTSGRRLAYARALTSGRHPLVARVLVNRFWMHHFGRGLVGSPGDFGMLGDLPSHPALLDWLASEFMANGWRLKPLHRLIMNSTVYRQSSEHPESQQADPENRFYGRWKLKRLEAETVRDSMLAVSGSLANSIYGEPVSIAQDALGRVVVGKQRTDGRGDPTVVDDIGERAFRRSVYVQVRRSLPLTVFEAFDWPVLSPNCESRTVSVVPSQPLMLLNDSFVTDQSERFAGRLLAECPGENPRPRITRAWQLAFNQPPTGVELTQAMGYLERQTELIHQRLAAAAADAKVKEPAALEPERAGHLALASLCQALFGSSRFLYTD